MNLDWTKIGDETKLSDVAKVGDYVKVDGIEGYVEDINIRSTKIRDLDNFLISVPNNVAANVVITNVSRAKKRFINMMFGVTYSTDNDSLQKAQEILKEVALAHKDIHKDFVVAIHDLGDSAINIRFRGYVKSGSYEKFLQLQENDKIKNKLAIERGYKILRIPFSYENKLRILLTNLFSSTTISEESRGKLLEIDSFL